MVGAAPWPHARSARVRRIRNRRQRGRRGEGVRPVRRSRRALLFRSPRSETLGGLGGTSRDERWAAIDLRASAFGGFVVLIATIGAWLYELAEGRDGSPYGELLAVGGIAYIVAVAFLRRRG
jgi:hypothetical protein